jgi:hypothetical protein
MLPETVKTAPATKISPLQYVKNVFEFYVSPELAGKRWKYIICIMVFSFSILSFFGRISVETLYQLSTPFCWNSVHIGWFAALRIKAERLLKPKITRYVLFFLDNVFLNTNPDTS